MTRADASPARLVVRMPNWLGDAVMALPALAAVRAALPDTWLALAALPSIAPAFKEHTGARPQQILVLDQPDDVGRLREGTFDAALLLTNSFRTAWTARRSGIAERWGYAAGGRGPLLTRAIGRPRGERHQSEYYLELVRGLGMAAPAASPGVGNEATPADRIRLTDATRERARRLLADAGIAAGSTIVGFAPGAAYGHAKRWPPDRVAQVVTRVTRERGARCVLVGVSGDREAGRAIESTVPPDVHVVNLIGRTDLRLLMGVLEACRVFVSNDSGAMHLAAAVGVPVTAIFGPTNERATAPIGDHDVILHQVFCRPCMLRECPIDHRCMKRIGVDEVSSAVMRRIDRYA
ncbi:MAG TPA: lipopolysaccharide heptosyltransferase II [Vicinamibacterales bacterium]|nr:lipopolysaccharide heptosyltransferase II [Vicinamibacterales bacterium]